MNGAENGLNLAGEPDFALGSMRVSPSACRILVGSAETRVEAKTMGVLVTLARAGGGTVTRDDLINACWEGRIVSDDAIARAIAKVRALTKGVEPEPFTLETVPKVGYRLVAAQPSSPPDPTPPVELVASAPASAMSPASTPATASARLRTPTLRRFVDALPNPLKRLVGIVTAAALAAAAPLAASLFQQIRGDAAGSAKVAGEQPEERAPTSKCAQISTPASGLRSADVAEALINLDERRVRAYIDAGWDPRWTTDPEGSQALHVLMLACERDPTHDQAAVVRIAKMLVANCANPFARNGAETHDTPLVIAKNTKYCGPAHPVVAYLTSLEADPNDPSVFVQPKTAPSESNTPRVFYDEQVSYALRYVDERGVRAFVDAGWDPATWVGPDRNTALQILMEACERDHDHDREALVRIAKLLVANGVDPATQNIHKDTALTIARDNRFCKPDHPVVAYLKSLEDAATH